MSKQNQELRVKYDKTSNALVFITKENEEMKSRIEELEKQKEDTLKLVEHLQSQVNALSQSLSQNNL